LAHRNPTPKTIDRRGAIHLIRPTTSSAGI
jgi:hypothetical protein